MADADPNAVLGTLGVATPAPGLKAAMSRRLEAEKDVATADAATETEMVRQRQDWKTFEKDHPFPKLETKPWTEKPPEPDPARSFGSAASVLGILMSAFTRQPLTSALNASASAMKAIRTSDLNAYHEAQKAWEKNTELAMKNAEWEVKGYNAALDRLNTDHAEGLAMMKTHAAAANNKAVLALADAGQYEKMAQVAQGMQEGQIRMQEARMRIQAMYDSENQAIDIARQKHPDFDKVAEAASKGDRQAAAQLSSWRNEGRIEVERQESAAKRAGLFGATSEQGGAGLTEEARDAAAVRYLETGQFPYSKWRGAPENTAIMNRGAQLAKDAGLTPEEIAALPATKTVEKGALLADMKTYDGLNRAMSGLEGQLPIVQEYVDKLPLGKIQMFNDLILRGEVAVGDPDWNAYANAMTTLAQSVGRIMAGGAQSAAMTPVEALKVGMQRLSPKMSPAQFAEESKLLRKEGANQVDAAHTTMMDRKKSLFSLKGDMTPASGAKTGAADKYVVGQTYTDANGNTATYKGNGQWEEH